jgi:leader peptidase (prepilin peptidase)/N-methyltransferase
LLFVGLAWADLASTPQLSGALLWARILYHQSLSALLIAATFVDADFTIIPDEITIPGMVIGLAGGTLLPMIRLEPAAAMTSWQGFLSGLSGLIVGGGIIWIIRLVGSFLFRREAMGFGDVTLMAMIGSYLGWEPMPPILFFAAFLGLIPSLGRCLIYIVLKARSWFSGKKRDLTLGEIPFGPWLSLAAILLLLSWRWIWPHWLEPQYSAISLIAELIQGGS